MTGIVSASATGQTTYVDNGTSTTYTLQTGDSLYISRALLREISTTGITGEK